MAKVVNDFPEASGRTRYPWDQWLDGQVWLVTKGEDYHVETVNFRSAAYQAAEREGINLETQIGPEKDQLYIRAKRDVAEITEAA